jgi:hypothetical protein
MSIAAAGTQPLQRAGCRSTNYRYGYEVLPPAPLEATLSRSPGVAQDSPGLSATDLNLVTDPFSMTISNGSRSCSRLAPTNGSPSAGSLKVNPEPLICFRNTTMEIACADPSFQSHGRRRYILQCFVNDSTPVAELVSGSPPTSTIGYVQPRPGQLLALAQCIGRRRISVRSGTAHHSCEISYRWIQVNPF